MSDEQRGTHSGQLAVAPVFQKVIFVDVTEAEFLLTMGVHGEGSVTGASRYLHDNSSGLLRIFRTGGYFIGGSRGFGTAFTHIEWKKFHTTYFGVHPKGTAFRTGRMQRIIPSARVPAPPGRWLEVICQQLAWHYLRLEHDDAGVLWEQPDPPPPGVETAPEATLRATVQCYAALMQRKRILAQHVVGKCVTFEGRTLHLQGALDALIHAEQLAQARWNEQRIHVQHTLAHAHLMCTAWRSIYQRLLYDIDVLMTTIRVVEDFRAWRIHGAQVTASLEGLRAILGTGTGTDRSER